LIRLASWPPFLRLAAYLPVDPIHDDPAPQLERPLATSAEGVQIRSSPLRYRNLLCWACLHNFHLQTIADLVVGGDIPNT